MSKKLPAITPMQFLVLGLLREDEQPGRVLREALEAHGVKRSAPAFYQLMARLERDRLVEGWYEQVTVPDQAVTQRRYRLRPPGREALDRGPRLLHRHHRAHVAPVVGCIRPGWRAGSRG